MAKENKKTGLYDYKLGEIIDSKYLGNMKELFKGDVKCVAIAYTFQDKEGIEMESKLKHKDYIEYEDD